MKFYEKFIRKLRVQKFLGCFKLETGGLICIWYLLTYLMFLVILFLDTVNEHLIPEVFCKNQLNETANHWLVSMMHCTQSILEAKLLLIYIKIAILLLLLFFGLKSTNAVEKVSFTRSVWIGKNTFKYYLFIFTGKSKIHESIQDHRYHPHFVGTRRHGLRIYNKR